MPVDREKIFQFLASKPEFKPPAEEIKRAIACIEENTYLVDQFVATPPREDLHYEVEPLSKFLDAGELSNRITDILRANSGRIPQDIYLLVEEVIQGNPEGLVKLPLPHFLKHIVPYIFEEGRTETFWLTDCQTTITLHHEGLMYWNRNR